MKIVVSGTGFSSILCINHLIKLGIKPTVYDVGNDIDEDKKIILKKKSIVKQKDFDSFLCKGGLSEVWSGVIEKYLENDFLNWPINKEDFDIHYEEVLKNLKDYELYSFYSSAKDNFLDYNIKKVNDYKNIELYNNGNISIKYSNILGKKINDQNLLTHENFKPYNIKDTINDLIKGGQIIYKKEKILKVWEEENQVVVESVNSANLINKSKFDYLFMGSGCISTYLIMKNSLPNFNDDIKIKSTKQFVMPVRLFNVVDFNKKFYNMLPFMQLNLTKNYDYSIYSQIYNFNSNIINFFLPKIRIFEKYISLFKFFKNFGISYFNLGSNYSDTFTIDKNFNLKLYEKKYKVSEILGKESEIFNKKLLNNQFFHMNFPIKMKPLSGNHFGACFPMQLKKKKFYYSDLYGRIGNFKKISITDSSIFPQLSARPPTFTILANALRIISEVSKLNFFR